VGARASAYVAAAVRAETDRIRIAASGRHNHSIYLAAVALGQLVAGRALTHAHAHSALRADAEIHTRSECGCTGSETDHTINSGLRAGAKHQGVWPHDAVHPHIASDGRLLARASDGPSRPERSQIVSGLASSRPLGTARCSMTQLSGLPAFRRRPKGRAGTTTHSGQRARRARRSLGRMSAPCPLRLVVQ
jgi:hypothetical protein